MFKDQLLCDQIKRPICICSDTVMYHKLYDFFSIASNERRPDDAWTIDSPGGRTYLFYSIKNLESFEADYVMQEAWTQMEYVLNSGHQYLGRADLARIENWINDVAAANAIDA